MWTGKDYQLTNSIENNLFETLSLFLSLSLLLFHYRMSAVAALSLREAIIPLQQSFNIEDLYTVKVEHQWEEGNPAVSRSYKTVLPVIDDPSKKEQFFYVIDQFMDACSNDRLHLSQGPQRYNKFREVLQGSLRLSWQTISANRGNNKSTNSFDEDVRALISTIKLTEKCILTITSRRATS